MDGVSNMCARKRVLFIFVLLSLPLAAKRLQIKGNLLVQERDERLKDVEVDRDDLVFFSRTYKINTKKQHTISPT